MGDGLCRGPWRGTQGLMRMTRVGRPLRDPPALLLPQVWSFLKEVMLLHVQEGNRQVGFYSSLLIRACDPTSKVNLLSSPTLHPVM